MWTNLHWINGPWPGRLAVAARPRGGDWLDEEIRAWRQAGVDAVVSLLTPDEERDLDLESEQREVRRRGMKFISLPIPDRQVPSSQSAVGATLEEVDTSLSSGRNVVIHCRQGIGRSGLIAACLLIAKGLSSGAALESVSAARGVPVPETEEQRRWIDRFAAVLPGAK